MFVDSLLVTVQTATQGHGSDSVDLADFAGDADHAHLYPQSRPTPPVSGLTPAVVGRWPLRPCELSRWGRLPPALGRQRQPAETVKFIRLGPADARCPQPGRPADAHPSPLTPGV
jgi:hypothetical protein